MKNLKIAGLVMIIAVALMSASCSGKKSSESAGISNPELWKVLTESDWAFWSGPVGVEMKFVGENQAIIMEWSQDTVTKAWTRKGSDVGQVVFFENDWFVIHYTGKSTACLYSKGDNSYENSDGCVFRKSQINTFRVKK